MASLLPSRLLRSVNGEFTVIDPRLASIGRFDIISYTWGAPASPYNCRIPGVEWNVTISREKLGDIKRLMVSSGIEYLWADCVCT